MGIWVCDDALILALKYVYIKGQQTQTFRSFGIKLPGHVVTACTLSSTLRLSSQVNALMILTSVKVTKQV